MDGDVQVFRGVEDGDEGCGGGGGEDGEERGEGVVCLVIGEVWIGEWVLGGGFLVDGWLLDVKRRRGEVPVELAR